MTMPGLSLRYFGTSAFEIVTEGGKRVVIDPCITGWNGKNISPVPLDDVVNVDLILVTHAAPDHFGDTLELLRRSRADVVCDPAVQYILLDSGIAPERISVTVWGMVRDLGGVVVRCVESKHVSCTRYKGQLITGLPNGYLVTTETGRTVYHPGDTAIFSDMKLFGQLYKPEAGLLPISGFPGIPAEMSIEEAALATEWLKLRTVVPMHYELGSAEPAEFVSAVKRTAPWTRVLVPAPGEWISLPGHTA